MGLIKHLGNDAGNAKGLSKEEVKERHTEKK